MTNLRNPLLDLTSFSIKNQSALTLFLFPLNSIVVVHAVTTWYDINVNNFLDLEFNMKASEAQTKSFQVNSTLMEDKLRLVEFFVLDFFVFRLTQVHNP